MKFYYVFIIAVVILLFNIHSILAYDTLKIDTILRHDSNTVYNFPKQIPLILSGNHDMCPKKDCKLILDNYVHESTGDGVTLNAEPNNMTLNGYIKLTGSGNDKGILDLLFTCNAINTEKNPKLGTTTYICHEGDGNFVPENEQLGVFDYVFTASFELPSGHFVFNGTYTGTT
jgi:hypothetical protein